MRFLSRRQRAVQLIRAAIAVSSFVVGPLAIAQTEGPTLYLAHLRTQDGVTSAGSGTAALQLSADETSAVVSFSYSNLTSAITGMHIHGPADPGQTGSILFDLDSTTPQPDGSYIWTFTPAGENSVADIVNAIKAGRTYLNIHTGTYPSGEISGWFYLSTGAQSPPVPTPPPALASGTPTPQDAGRFLSQSTFGATTGLISKVQNEGFDVFLDEQFAAPISSHMAFVDATRVNPPTYQQTTDAWWTYAVSAPDQLRQRVAFALSELLVVSKNDGSLGGKPGALPTYMDVLVNNAFGNFRQLLQDITLNPAMGRYLNMLGNDKANAKKKLNPNENFARELLQLFSIGLYQLNLDGSLKLDSRGLPVDTYQQDAVLGLASVFTGWTYAQSGTPVWLNPPQNWREPMMIIASHHSTGEKRILDGVIIAAGQTADQDLQTALDTIFNHPNVGSFICRQLIQRLVTSNPSPGYIYRVASVFNDNGQGIRGDLQAVVRAILMDYDARGPALATQGAGHEREPVIRLTNLLRAFNASSSNGTFSVRNAISPTDTSLAQEPMNSPTVFNFFSPDYQAPGAVAQAGLYSPEFQLTSEVAVATIANYLNKAIYTSLGPSTNKIALNLSGEQILAKNPAQLVDHLNSLLMAGNMSSAMRTTLINAVTSIPVNSAKERVRTALYLVVNSPESVIDK
jgi:uncharacterized protein (DUF1800 family)